MEKKKEFFLLNLIASSKFHNHHAFLVNKKKISVKSNNNFNYCLFIVINIMNFIKLIL